MTEKKTKILLVEDDMIIAADLSMQLSKLDYDVIGINTRAEDAIMTIEGNRPDMILMDIILNGKMDGIEAAQIILDRFQIPLIFITSNTDDATFQRALVTKPHAFISKPFQKSDLERSMKIALQQVTEAQTAEPTDEAATDHVSTMDDRLFIRHKQQLVKVFIRDILYIAADRNYCHLHTEDQDYFLSISLRSIESKLPRDKFVRVHRSYVVNLRKIDAVSEHHEYVVIQSKQVPVSRRMKEDVMKHLNLI